MIVYKKDKLPLFQEIALTTSVEGAIMSQIIMKDPSSFSLQLNNRSGYCQSTVKERKVASRPSITPD